MTIRPRAVACLVFVALLALTLARSGPAMATAVGPSTWSARVSVAPIWSDPAEHQELDRKRREGFLPRIDRTLDEQLVFVPVPDLAALNGAGLRVEGTGFAPIKYDSYPSPNRDLRLKQ